jgi:hypothetical protein
LTQDFRGEYEFESIDGGLIRVTAKGPRKKRSIDLPSQIQLTPTALSFLGMYSGDGNKTGTVGFAQRNVELLEAACTGFVSLFGDTTRFSINVLNDSRYFMRAEFRIKQDQLPTLNARAVPAALGDYLWQEFQSEVAHLPRLRAITNHSATVSPLKGAREPGEESREYIVSLPDSAPYLPILLLLIEHLNHSFHHDAQAIEVGGKVILDWGARPSAISLIDVDLEHWIKTSDQCRWFASGKEKRYPTKKLSSTDLEVGSTSPFRCKAAARLGPLTSYAAGLYLAEGTTDKATLIHFHQIDRDVKSVALSFNSSEGTSLAIFLNSLRECLGYPQEVISSWKVKVGSQFMYECQVLGEIYQAPMVRRGEKGQGKSPSCVQAGYFREWAVKEFEDLQSAVPKFSHVEFTGAGVPRVQVTCSSSPARLLFSLYKLATGDLLEACYAA